MDTEITIEYPSPRFAKSVVDALTPDNKMKKNRMKIIATARGKQLRVVVRNCERIETFQLTVQDIFRCIRAAETSIGKAK
jgi:tRNA threonylcarbamoyladenosine modification (KEOPS) complex  Pcc1 subunit